MHSRGIASVDEYQLEAARETERSMRRNGARQMADEQQEEEAANSSPSRATHTLTSMSSGGSSSFESRSDPNNELVRAILAMARQLGIDATSEYYLLPIAMHALESPQEWQRVSADSETYAQARTDIDWFQALVQTERARFRKTPSDNTPWVKIRETPAMHAATTSPNGFGPAAPAVVQATSAPFAAAAASVTSSSSAASTTAPPPPSRSYWFNFKTFRRSATLPPSAATSGSKSAAAAAAADSSGLVPLSSTSSSSAAAAAAASRHAELTVLKFTSWYVEAGGGSERKRYIQVAYHLSSEEFEVTLVNRDPTASPPDQRAETESKVFRVKNLKTKQGTVASCWDLHLKATLDIFGRPTTLLHSDTRSWLETNASRLLQVRALLEQKLSKYENITEKRRANVPLVEYHLRALMKDVARLKNALTAYRPSLAEKLAL